MPPVEVDLGLDGRFLLRHGPIADRKNAPEFERWGGSPIFDNLHRLK